ncbi:MAG: cation transporter [Firmicutes bacterium]|nr:cation transporter [Bacillota bacterium]
MQQTKNDNDSRNKTIIKTGIIGIIANLFLAAFKAAIGVVSNSIAITLDAVNNLSDAASSVITIAGTKLASKEPDKKHPFGYGRIEYLSALIISLIVLYAGVTSLTESIRKIISPETPEYSIPALIIIAVGIIVKIILGKYVKNIGEKVNSESLINSGEDAALDSIISASTFVAAIIYIFSGYSLEAWLGAVISAVIIKSGLEMISSTLSQILGERADAQLARNIKDTVCQFPDVSGAYDLILNNYGPDAFNGSVHIEVPDTKSADELDELIRDITLEVYRKYNVLLTAVGVYSINTKDNNVIEMREKIKRELFSTEYITQMHAFYVNENKKTIRFDIIISFDAPDRWEVLDTAKNKVKALYPDYEFRIAMDTDFSDE